VRNLLPLHDNKAKQRDIPRPHGEHVRNLNTCCSTAPTSVLPTPHDGLWCKHDAIHKTWICPIIGRPPTGSITPIRRRWSWWCYWQCSDFRRDLNSLHLRASQSRSVPCWHSVQPHSDHSISVLLQKNDSNQSIDKSIIFFEYRVSSIRQWLPAKVFQHLSDTFVQAQVWVPNSGTVFN